MGRNKKRSNQQLLTAARTVFLESGFAGSTLEIAHRAEVAEATLFKRFGTKAHLFAAAMAPPADDARAAVVACAGTDDGLEFLTCSMIAMLGYFRRAAPGTLAWQATPICAAKCAVFATPTAPKGSFLRRLA